MVIGSKTDINNQNSVRCEASRYFRNKKGEYLKGNINEFDTNSKNRNMKRLVQWQQ